MSEGGYGDGPSGDGSSGELVHTTPSAVEIPVAQFEGEYIRHMMAKLPAISIEMPVGYKKGTHLKLEIEMRVKEVGFPEMKVAGESVTVRVHTLAFEDVKLLGAYTADELDPGVGGLGDEGGQS